MFSKTVFAAAYLASALFAFTPAQSQDVPTTCADGSLTYASFLPMVKGLHQAYYEMTKEEAQLVSPIADQAIIVYVASEDIITVIAFKDGCKVKLGQGKSSVAIPILKDMGLTDVLKKVGIDV